MGTAIDILHKAAAIGAAAMLAAAAGAGVSAAPASPAAPRDLCRPGLAQIVGTAARSGRPAYLACLPVAARPLRGARVDPRYSAAVSAAVGARAVVVCWGNRPWAELGRITQRAFGSSITTTGGFTWDGQQVANLPGRLCRYLDAVTYGHVRRVDRSIAWAFKNLTHEAIHVAGVDDEAATECYALQLMSTTMTDLGLGHGYAGRVARLSWARYPRMRIIGPRYWTPACHDDGPLDLRPGTARWPS